MLNRIWRGVAFLYISQASSRLCSVLHRAIMAAAVQMWLDSPLHPAFSIYNTGHPGIASSAAQARGQPQPHQSTAQLAAIYILESVHLPPG